LEQVAKKENKFLKILGWVFSIIFFAVCAVIIFFNLTHEYHTVSGDSMYPTLNGTTETDGVFVSKIKGYGRGDILVVNKGEKDAYGQDIFVVKRLIAIGGDKITIREVDGYFRIILIYNGEPEPSAKTTDENLRTAICQINENNFILFNNSFSSPRRGFSFVELQKYMLSLGCKYGYNLDGGGSIALMYKEQKSTNPTVVRGNGRRVADILYFHE